MMPETPAPLTGDQAPPPAADQASAPDQGVNRKAEQSTNQAGTAPTKAEEPDAKAPKIPNTENASKQTPPNNRAAKVPKTRESASATESDQTPVEKAELTPAARRERIASTNNGADELAMAQRYLSGENGQRDPSQAAQWLWKSVAKQNSQATLLLADLYLHGDGIQKNCDQARILLDAAASKGQSGAATRLRNLQAFGCQ